jgi:predicted DNA-binding protein with PD1-like motif
MKVAEAHRGRTFVIRLEDGEILHEVIEAFAREKGIRAAALIAVGGADKDSRLIVGPVEGRAAKMVSQELKLDEVHEVAGTGTLFPDEQGQPILHMHLAAGRGREAVVGCARIGVKVWHVLEVILIELLGTRGVRKLDPKLGFKLLEP